MKEAFGFILAIVGAVVLAEATYTAPCGENRLSAQDGEVSYRCE